MIPHAFVSVHMAGTDVLPPATEQVRYDLFVQNLAKPQTEQLMKLHGALGVCGEAGELADAIKKECIYGKAPDRANIIEELGDLQWYIQLIMLMYEITPDEVFQLNADKLSERYVNLKYSDRAAQERADKNPK